MMDSPDREVTIGLHEFVEIVYEVDRYRATVLNAQERVVDTGFGATPSAALSRLASVQKGPR